MFPYESSANMGNVLPKCTGCGAGARPGAWGPGLCEAHQIALEVTRTCNSRGADHALHRSRYLQGKSLCL